MCTRISVFNKTKKVWSRGGEPFLGQVPNFSNPSFENCSRVPQKVYFLRIKIKFYVEVLLYEYRFIIIFY